MPVKTILPINEKLVSGRLGVFAYWRVPSLKIYKWKRFIQGTDINMTYQIFKQRCVLGVSRLLTLTWDKQVASKLNLMPVKESNGVTCAWYTMAMVYDTKNCFLYTNVDGHLEVIASSSKNLTTHEKWVIQ